MSHAVNNPAHYTQHPVECIEITRHLPFALGNAVKYVWSANDKGNRLQDLQKAIWYLQDYQQTGSTLQQCMHRPRWNDLWEKIVECQFEPKITKLFFNIVRSQVLSSETIHDVMIKDAINLLQNIIKTTTESQP